MVLAGAQIDRDGFEVDGDRVLNESVAIVLYLAEKYPDRGLIPQESVERARFCRWLFFAATELEQPLWRIARDTALYPEVERQASETVAGFVLASTLDWANEVQLLDGYPELVSYMECMYARPNAAPRIAAAFAALDA